MQGPTTTRASFYTNYSALESSVSRDEVSGLHHLVTVHACCLRGTVCLSFAVPPNTSGGVSTQYPVRRAATHWLGILASRILFGQNVIKHVDIHAKSREDAEACASYDMAWILAHADAIWCDLEV